MLTSNYCCATDALPNLSQKIYFSYFQNTSNSKCFCWPSQFSNKELSLTLSLIFLTFQWTYNATRYLCRQTMFTLLIHTMILSGLNHYFAKDCEKSGWKKHSTLGYTSGYSKAHVRQTIVSFSLKVAQICSRVLFCNTNISTKARHCSNSRLIISANWNIFLMLR